MNENENKNPELLTEDETDTVSGGGTAPFPPPKRPILPFMLYDQEEQNEQEKLKNG
jgi:hypothetical protein